jgi:hypothetical protein
MRRQTSVGFPVVRLAPDLPAGSVAVKIRIAGSSHEPVLPAPASVSAAPLIPGLRKSHDT